MRALVLLFPAALIAAISSYFSPDFYAPGGGSDSSFYMIGWAFGTLFVWCILLLIAFFVQLYRHAEP